MVVRDGSFVLRISFSIDLRNVAIRFVAKNYKHLSGSCRFDGLGVLLDLPPLAGSSHCSPVCWLDAVEEDSSIVDELELFVKLGIIIFVEIPVDVEGLSVVIFELVRICAIFPASFKDTTSFVVLNGCTSPDSSFWRYEAWSLVHATVWS